MVLKAEEFIKEFDERAQKAADEIEATIDELFRVKKFSILDDGDVMFENIRYFNNYLELDKKIFEIVKNTFIANGWGDVEQFNDCNIILRHKK